MKQYTHLTIFEREMLDRLLFRGMSLTDIAHAMGRSKSTLSREITRSRMTRGSYRAFSAEVIARKKCQIPKKPTKIATNEQLQSYIHDHLKADWSPEQIANRLKKEYPTTKAMHVSHETIYTYLYVLPRGELKKELMSHLR